MELLNGIALGTGWTLILGLLFWGLCMGLSYARIGIQRGLARREERDRD